MLKPVERPSRDSSQARILLVRRSDERGHFNFGWLNTYHSFSFGDYYDPKFMGFRTLRAINEDRVSPKGGFPTHPHRDMEIITYVLQGRLAHADSMGNVSVIKAGEFQRMSAGTGVMHSEFNPSEKKDDEPLHLFQIWILPERKRIEPSYEQKEFSEAERTGNLRLVASKDGRAGSLHIHQDVSLYSAILNPGISIEDRIADGRFAWIQVVRGVLNINGETVSAGDGLALQGGGTIEIHPPIEGIAAELLLFDLA